ncbi:MAG: hypothetical protein HIU90_01400 [Proteobacteria bacterium]|nr:hypothetical protein [Pseudomonadota bacterium]
MNPQGPALPVRLVEALALVAVALVEVGARPIATKALPGVGDAAMVAADLASIKARAMVEGWCGDAGDLGLCRVEGPLDHVDELPAIGFGFGLAYRAECQASRNAAGGGYQRVFGIGAEFCQAVGVECLLTPHEKHQG